MIFLRIVFLFSIVISFPLHSAAPAAHVYFAEQWMRVHGINTPSDQEKLIVGTLFPDIRYLGTISRKKTHESKVTAELIRGTDNPFDVGRRLHAYVDKKREKFVKKTRVLELLSKVPKKNRVLFLKTLEDEILWNKTRVCFSQHALRIIYPEEILCGVDEQTAFTWHRTMIDYLTQRPSEYLQKLAIRNEGFLQADAKTVAEWCRLIPELAAHPLFIEYTRQLDSYLLGKFIPKQSAR